MFLFFGLWEVRKSGPSDGSDNPALLWKSAVAKLQAELERIVRVLVEQYDPECVILYGSFAHGDIHEWSDLDLCVIKRTEKRFIERLEEVGLLTLPRVGCQILVYTPEELEAVKQQGHYFFVDEILGKGKVLYERGKGICLPTG